LDLKTARTYVAYYRVSTDSQGRSGLGLEAQRQAVHGYIERQGGELASDFTEVESGRNEDRPQLKLALIAARATGAVLVIAKLDRLARNARFLLTIVEGAGDAGVAFCDLPELPPGPVGKFIVTMLAAVAELEAGLISERTKAALVAAKARGVKLGNPSLRAGDAVTARNAARAKSERARAKAADILPYILEARSAGARSLAQISRALEARGVRTPGGRTKWAPAQVARVLSSSARPASGWPAPQNSKVPVTSTFSR
jgi:DNA invertase Pin-like site-specific DNA recombinase